MDLTALLIGLGLVWTGAAFFGYPVGRIIERRRIDREQSLYFRRYLILQNSDILDAEILEKAKR